MHSRFVSNLPEEKVLEICELDRQRGGRPVEKLARLIQERWRADGTIPPHKKISRQLFYEICDEGNRRNLYIVTPRSHHALQRALCERYGHDPAAIRVAATESRGVEHVAIEAARVLVSLIVELRRKRRSRTDGSQRVHIGFGAGWSVRLVAYHLSLLLRSSTDIEDLTFHAISSGFVPDQPLTAPVTFFGFFERAAPGLSYLGLFAPPFVPWDEFLRAKRQAGIREAYAWRDQIDIVVTSLASARDEHGDLRSFLGTAAREKLLRLGHVGDVQHLPYSDRAPITEPIGNRAVTLFELRDLVDLAKTPERSVLLISGPCGVCHRNRADALVPLLRSPALKVWTHLVTDIPTSRELLKIA